MFFGKNFLLSFFCIFGCFILTFAQDEHKENLQGPFDSPQEVTETCLTCHEDVGDDIIKTRHWNWQGEKFCLPNGSWISFGKKNIINNFCIAIYSNWPRCTSCHIGYGWQDENFDFSDPKNIDCLICHDKTGTYAKAPAGAGMPLDNVDLAKVAVSVGKPSRQNCGSCHFYGGGGDAVKHGDLDKSLERPSGKLDVHMGGSDFSCTECHHTEKHEISGASHGSMAEGVNHISCLDCHDAEPHTKEKLNKHVAAVSCEACHIPEIGRGNPTKIWWDWSTAGQDSQVKKDKYGKELYNKKKGSFKWAKNIQPAYCWYNGRAQYYQIYDKIEPGKILKINTLDGKISDATAKIFPFKIMRGKQMYDFKYKYLIIPKLYGENGYWSKWDWQLAFKTGMEKIGMDYSGQYDFVETEFYIPVNHMVAPKEDALKCWDCHHKTKGRLDWKKLGYPGDPMKNKGRATNKLLK